jgi:hypothetical protein
VNNEFCGTLTLTLSYISGNKTVSLASINKAGTITVQPISLQTHTPPALEIYDHGFFGEHEFSVSVDWVVKPALPAIPTIITDRVAISRTFKVIVTSVCTESLITGGPDPPIDVSALINHIPDRSRIFRTIDKSYDTASLNAITEYSRAYPANPYFCGDTVTTLTLTEFE